MSASDVIFNPTLQGEPFYWEAGAVGVLLIHGFTATTAEVRPLAKILYERGYTVSGPLLPGHYTSPEELNRVRWQDWVEAMQAAYQELKSRCQQVFIGGESTGGLLALYLASQHPQALGVLAYAPALKLTYSRFDLVRLYAIAPFVPSVSKGEMEKDSIWQGYYVYPLKAIIQLLGLQRETLTRLPLIHQPLLIMQGRLDMTVHPTVPGLIAAGVSSNDITIRWMAESTHCVILDKELDCAADFTLKFLQRILESSPTPS
jgi:carboxylesterase